MPIEPMQPVVVGVDGSDESLAALDLAADEAAGRVTPLVVVHAYPRAWRPAVAPGAPEPARALNLRRRLLNSAVGRVSAEHPCLAVEGDLVPGEPAEVLLSRSAHARLLVVGHSGSGLDGPPLGGVALRVAQHAPAPVLVHRPFHLSASVVSPRPVLVCVDGLAGAEPLVGFAFDAAALRGVPLVAMYVWSQPAGAVPAGIHPEAYGYADARDEADRMLAEALAGWSGKYPDVPVRREVRHSLDVVRTLREASASAQLVVVGRSRHNGIAGLLLGSVSRAMVQRAGCPVAVIP